MLQSLRNFHKDERGQDLVEYGLIALLVALGVITGMGQLASSINNEFIKIGSSLT